MSDHVDHGCNNNHDHDNHDDCDVHGDHGDYLTMMKLVTMMTMTTKTTLSTKISISCVPIYIVIRLEHCWMSTDFYRKCLRIVVWDWNNGKHWDVNFCESLLQLSGKVGHYYGNACSTLWGGSCIINTNVIENIDWYGKWKLNKLYYIFTFKNSCSDLGAVSLILFWNSDLMKKYNCISSIKDVMQDISTSLYSFCSCKNSNPLKEPFRIKYYFNKHLYSNTVSSWTGWNCRIVNWCTN